MTALTQVGGDVVDFIDLSEAVRGNAVKGEPALPAVAGEGPALDPAHHAVGRDAASAQAAGGRARGLTADLGS